MANVGGSWLQGSSAPPASPSAWPFLSEARVPITWAAPTTPMRSSSRQYGAKLLFVAPSEHVNQPDLEPEARRHHLVGESEHGALYELRCAPDPSR